MGVRIYTRVKIPQLNYSSYRALRKWCKEQFGTSKSTEAKDAGRPWYATRCWVHILQDSGYGQVQQASFYFRNPAHATMFQLVWSK